MYTIKTNKSGTRSMEITEEHLLTIEKYQLMSGLVDSNGIVDEAVLDKLKLTVRSLIVAQDGCKDLLDLCIDVIYHNNMKAFGLNALIAVYNEWAASREQTQQAEE
ncbi:MAG: hypothetical protein IKJ18_04830 [Bacteroidaceae bacterium]|nr:hypothetical protein [Bacteroidaceae bacterium]